jgi:hypothetical protein
VVLTVPWFICPGPVHWLKLPVLLPVWQLSQVALPVGMWAALWPSPLPLTPLTWLPS